MKSRAWATEVREKAWADDRGLPQGQGQEQDQGNGHQVDQDAQEGDHLEVEGHQGSGGQGGHHRHHKPLLDPEKRGERRRPGWGWSNVVRAQLSHRSPTSRGSR